MLLVKSEPMTQRLPSLVVPDDMKEQLDKISKDAGLSLSETVRQAITFFLHEYVKNLSNDANDINQNKLETDWSNDATNL